METINNLSLYAIGWAINTTGWWPEHIDKLTVKRLMGINKKLGGLRVNMTESKRWDHENKEYIDDPNWVFVYLQKGDDIRHVNVDITEFLKEFGGEKMEETVYIDVRSPKEIKDEPRTEQDKYINIEDYLIDSSKLDKGKNYIIKCKSGARARNVASGLAADGFNIIEVGGLD